MNGQSQGRRSKRVKLMLGSYRLVWPAVRYQPGELKAIAYDDAGQPVAETVTRTAGEPAAIALLPDRASIAGDGDDMAFVTVRILDAHRQLCPTADNLVAFRVDGPAEIAAVDNGNAASLEPFQADHRRAFNGLCVVYLRSLKDRLGTITLHAAADGLAAARATLQAGG